MRFANNPTAPSYMDEAMAVHYNQKHSGDRANLKFGLITTACNTVLRKINEVFYIHNQELMISLKSSYYIGF